MDRTDKQQFLDTALPLAVSAGTLAIGLASCFLFYLNRETAVPAAWGAAGGARNDFAAWFNSLQMGLVVPLLTGIFGALILRRHVVPRIGWLFLAIGLLSAVSNFTGEYAIYGAYTRQPPLPGAGLAAWITNFAWVLVFGANLYLLAIFPNARFFSRRWRVLILTLLAFFMIPLIAGAVIETPFSSGFQIANPFVNRHPAELYDALFAIGVPAMPLCVVAVLGAVLVRFRHSQGRARQQMKWLLAGVVLMAGAVLTGLALSFGLELTIGDIIVNASGLGPLVGVGVALVRHQLYGIDIIIRRTLLYTTVSAVLALLYFGSIVLLQGLFGALTGVEQAPLAVVVSTLAIAALFTPLRRRIQAIIDRRFYRKKYDAQQVLARFAITARDETDMNALTAELAQVVQGALEPEDVKVWLRKK